jgi:saccharopine dehydrogenase-like NADP-dependent oxidoreductase
LLLNECGLDPGIDHASAMKVIHEIQDKGGKITSFKSFCGGLVAPESNDNPWGYKFSWNPRNVILAGTRHCSIY